MLKIIHALTASVLSTVLLTTQLAGVVAAKSVAKNSPLCTSSKLDTMVGFSTPQFDVAICKAEDSENGYQYIGFDRKTKAKVMLPVTWTNNGQLENPWILKAKNGEYTYQVAQFHPLSEPETTASLSVFKNGTRIYHHIAKAVLIGEFGGTI